MNQSNSAMDSSGFNRDKFVLYIMELHQAGLKDLTYIRLGHVNHCPYSLERVESLYRIVDDFFVRTLMR